MSARRGPGRFGVALLFAGGVAAGEPLAGPELAAGGLAAQESGVPAGQEVAGPLSFDAAVRTALEHNPRYLREVNAVASSEYAERSRLGQAFLPSLSAGLSFGGGWSRRQTGEDDFGQPTSAPEFRETTSSSASQSVSGSVPLFNLSDIRSYAAARDQTAARAAAADYQAALLRTQVGQAYFGVIQRDDLVAVEERNVATARESLAAIRQLLRIGARQPTDVLGAELQLAQAERSLAEARGEARKARLQLNARMGVPLEREFRLTTGLPAVFDPTDVSAESLIERALRESPRMAQQSAGVQAAEADLSAAHAARYPALSGTFGYNRSLGVVGYDALGRFDLPDQGWNFGFGLSLPVFNRLATSTRVGQAHVAVLNAKESRREARLQLELEVRAAVIDLENAHAGVLVAERQVELGRERLAQGQELYRLGTLDYTDLQTMIDQLSGYERGLITARYRFAEALLQLEEKVGGAVVADTGG